MSKTVKLSHHQSAQCHVVLCDDGSIEFWSYTTLVIKANPQSLGIPYKKELGIDTFYTPDSETLEDGYYFLVCIGTYSATTRKQIGWFLKEYFGNVTYQDIKIIADEYEALIAHRCTAKFW